MAHGQDKRSSILLLSPRGLARLCIPGEVLLPGDAGCTLLLGHLPTHPDPSHGADWCEKKPRQLPFHARVLRSWQTSLKGPMHWPRMLERDGGDRRPRPS